MFDIGFWEIVVISVIGLIVLGPERLPIAARTLVHWIRKIKALSYAVKTEIANELKLDEIKDPINTVNQDDETDDQQNTAQSTHNKKNNTANQQDEDDERH